MGGGRGSNVLIVGAGSIGIITGYILSLAGANVTFLVRFHQLAALSQPQKLYCYDDNSMKEYSGYQLTTDPASLPRGSYDYVVVTLDGTALRNDVGMELVKTIGNVIGNTDTKIIFFSTFFNPLPWILDISGLSNEQVAIGLHAIHAYSPKATMLPLHSPTDPKLLAQADVAYADRAGFGICIAESNTTTAKSFTDLWNGSYTSKAIIVSTYDYALFPNPTFAVFAACQLLDWPSYENVDVDGYVWRLAVKAVQEIQRLGIHGENGQQAAELTTAESLAASMAQLQKQILPRDQVAFNRYQHGDKLKAQDCELLHECVAFGHAEGEPMSALGELIARVEMQERGGCPGRVVPAAWI